MTEPTQADRDAAAQAFFCKPLLNEKHNDDRRVRAFQRHRIASTAALQARVEELEAALRRCETIVERYNHRQNEKIEDVKVIVRAALGGDHA